MKTRVTSYTFDASAGEVDFTGYGSISLDAVLFVSNQTRGVLLFAPADPALGGTVSGHVLTLTYDTSAMADTDKLLIYYDDSTATQAVSGTVTATGPLTDTQLRAVAVPVSGTVTASGPLTDTQLRASAVPMSATALPLPTGAATSALQGAGLPAALGAGGGLKVDGSGTALPVSGTVTVSNPTTNPETGLAKDTSLGSLTETAPATDTASSGLNGRLQRIAQRLSSLIALLPSAIGITTKAGSLSVALASDQVSVPSWTDATSIVAITTLAKGAVSTTTFAVTSKFGAYVFVYLARTGTTALGSAIQVRIRRKILASPNIRNLAPEAAFSSDTAASVSGVCAGSGNNAGVTTLTLNGATTYATGLNGEIWIAILDSTSTPTTASEWARVSAQTSTTAKLLDAPTISAHNNTGHTVTDKANVFRAYVAGGCTYELIIDYGAAATGDTAVIQAHMQTLDSVAVA